MNRFTSRKFLMALGAVLAALGAALGNELTWTEAIMAITATVLAYMGVEGHLDSKAIQKGGE